MPSLYEGEAMTLEIHDYGPEVPGPEPHYSTEELQEQFKVIGFAMGYVVAVRKSDGVKGTLQFTHSPRIYFGWVEA